MTVGACSANCGNAAVGVLGAAPYKFIPATSILDVAGDSAPESDVPIGFYIF